MVESKSPFEELDRLTQVVEGLFQQATTRFAVPTALGCRMVALYLLGLRDTSQEKDKKPKSVRYGKLFLHHLLAERRQVEYWITLYSKGQPVEFWSRRDQKLLERIDQTQRSVEALLPALSPKYDERDPVRQIAAVATTAWQETNGGKAPRGKNPDDPLCKFVVAALSEMGQRISPAEVSDILRGRRRRQKEGQIL